MLLKAKVLLLHYFILLHKAVHKIFDFTFYIDRTSIESYKRNNMSIILSSKSLLKMFFVALFVYSFNLIMILLINFIDDNITITSYSGNTDWKIYTGNSKLFLAINKFYNDARIKINLNDFSIDLSFNANNVKFILILSKDEYFQLKENSETIKTRRFDYD
jgi:hypothetical protein